MNFRYPPNYGADNLDYRVFNEERVIASEIDKVIHLDYGAFFSFSVVVKNKATGRSLVAGRDYKMVEADFVGMQRSGREVCKEIIILTSSVDAVYIDYMFVGGEHMSGLHLLKEMRRIYPDGLEPRYEWDTTTDKPDTFKPKPHQMHVKSLYGFDGAAYSLDRMIAGVKRGHEANQNTFMTNVIRKLDSMTLNLKEDLEEAEDVLNELFDILSVQEGEYIFTDRIDNPAVARKYGNWVRVTNTILRGRSGKVVLADDVGNIYSKNLKQLLRSCYIWQNISGKAGVTYQLGFGNAISTNVYPLDETIPVSLFATGIVDGTPVHYTIYNEATGKPATNNEVYPSARGSFVINNGRGSVDIRFNSMPGSGVRQRKYTFRLDNRVSGYGTLTLNEPDYKTSYPLFKSNVSNTVLERVDEGQTFKLEITTQGYAVGDQLYLDWNGSSITSGAFTEGLPTQVTVPTGLTITKLLTLKSNLVSEGDRLLKLTIKDAPNDDIFYYSPTTSVIVNDVSANAKADIYFTDKSNNKVSSVDEGAEAKIFILTDIPNSELEVQYTSTRPLTDYTGLTSEVVTDNSGNAVIQFKAIEDFLTALGTQNLTVVVYYNNVEIGRNNIFITDTSKSPEYIGFFSRTPGGAAIEGIGEGEEFYYNVRVNNWMAGTVAPVLNFQYLFDDNAGTSDNYLNSRIESTFYPAMSFDSSSAVYNEVSWSGGNTLSFKMKAIANHAYDGATVFNVLSKQSNQTVYTLKTDLKIYDTSIYNVVATWSSSSTVLTPIATADEMKTNGTNNVVYLWIDAEGDGSLLGDITLNTTANKEFVTVFPNTIRFDKGASRKVVTVTILADFIKDGNVNLTLTGTYIPGGMTTPVEIFDAPLTIVDNSFRTPITALLLNKTTDTAEPADKSFSEWTAFFAKVTAIPYAFASSIDWSIQYVNANNAGHFVNESGTASLASNASSLNITLTPVKDRRKTGDIQFRFVAQRKRTSDNLLISDKYTSGIYILKDDAVPPTISIDYFASTTATTPLTSVDEGVTVYARVTVTDPEGPCYIGLSPTYDNVDTKLVNGVTYYGKETGFPVNVSYDYYKLTNKVVGEDKNTSFTVNIPISIYGDRTTNTVVKGMDVTAFLVSEETGLIVGATVAPEVLVKDGNIKANKAIGINDTQKTSVYTVAFKYEGTKLWEGDDFQLTCTIKDAIIGDVLYPEVYSTNGLDLTRLEVNGLGVEKVVLKNQEVLTWNFRTSKNRKTDGDAAFVVRVVNVKAAKMPSHVSVTVFDKYVDPDFKLSLTRNPNRPTDAHTAAIDEGDDGMYLYIQNLNSSVIDEDFILERVSGRAANQFPSGTFATHVNAVINTAGGSKIGEGALIPFYPKFDRTTNAAADNVITVKATTTISKVSVTGTFNIADTSQKPAILGMRWVAPGTETVVTSVDEGVQVHLQVRTNGGKQPTSVIILNNGGRDIARLKEHSYSVTKTRYSDDEWLTFPFTPLKDGQVNLGGNTFLSVMVNMVGLSVTQSTMLPINDTSTDTVTSISIHEKATGAIPTVLKEKVTYTVSAKVVNPVQDQTYKFDYSYNPYYGGGASRSQSIKTDLEDMLTFGPFDVYLVGTNDVTPMDMLYQLFTVTDPNKTLASLTLPVIDDVRPVMAPSYICEYQTTTQTSTISNGETYSFYVPHDVLGNVYWDVGTDHKLYWDLYVVNSDGSRDKTANGEYIAVASGVITKADVVNVGTADEYYRVNFKTMYTAAMGKTVSFHIREHYDIAGTTQDYEISRSNTAVTKAGFSAPAITDFYFSSDAAGNYRTTSANEGTTVYLQLRGVNLNDGASTAAVTVNLAFGGTASSDDFTTGLPSSVRMTSLSAANRTFTGSSTLYIKNDYKFG